MGSNLRGPSEPERVNISAYEWARERFGARASHP